MTKIYSELSLSSDNHSKTFYRIFDISVPATKLVWHRDKCNRKVTVIEGTGWYLQFDNCLPEPLEKNKTYHIPKNHYHRIIKGYDKLILEIQEKHET